jgi:outer membrane protein assembly factor BamD (BamD/ComL family)
MRFPRLALVPLALGALAAPALAQQDFTLDERDQWKAAEEPDPASPQGTLNQARVALARGEAKRARSMMEAWLERNPASPLRPDALLVLADSKLALGDEYDALFDYEEIARRYPYSAAFVPALERELDIARAYAGGLKRKFFGTVRIVPSEDDAQELFIRIQERLPGSALAEKAGMDLADFYFKKRDMPLAAEAYDLFVKNYPRSRQVDKARLRTIYAYYSGYNGPEYDAKGLLEASAKLRELQATQPLLAKQVGAEGLLVRVYESQAQKMLTDANWYWSVKDAISTERVIRGLVRKFPRSAAALQALRQIEMVLDALPATVRATTPDYAAIRRELLAQSARLVEEAEARAAQDLAAEAAGRDRAPSGAPGTPGTSPSSPPAPGSGAPPPAPVPPAPAPPAPPTP